MKKYDFIIVGAGAAMSIAFAAAIKNYKVALIEELQLGGTCLNRGCIPTKIMLQSAETAEIIKSSEQFGIDSIIKSANLKKIIQRIEDNTASWKNGLHEKIERYSNLDFYNCRTKFVDNKILEITENNEIKRIYGDKIILGVGMRPFIPKIQGIEGIDYLTNRNIFNMDCFPKSIAIIGGGYIGAEFSHFFSAFDVEVNVIEMQEKLLSLADFSISEEFTKHMKQKVNVYCSTKLTKIEKKDKIFLLHCLKDEKEFIVEVEKILMAVGRVSNADTLNLEATNVKIDNKNFIEVDDGFKTSNQDVYAIGDCTGSPAFRHIAGHQAYILRTNLFKNKKLKPNYNIIPSAVFTYPEIASVGFNFKEAKKQCKDMICKKLDYFATTKGRAIGFNGFAKVYIDNSTEKIIGFHIFGPYASILIHEILPLMTAGMSYKKILDTIHIHPSLSELILWTFTEGEQCQQPYFS
jgi:dihydrolipoamide dehydrogenase